MEVDPERPDLFRRAVYVLEEAPGFAEDVKFVVVEGDVEDGVVVISGWKWE